MHRKLKAGMKLLAGSVIAVSMMGWQAANAGQVFFQGFETDTSGWFDGSSGWFGSVTRTNTGVTPFEGSYVGKFEQSQLSNPADDTGPFTRFDGYRDTFPGTYSAKAAVYLDTEWALGEGFDYSVASNGSDGNHQRDFIFHVTKDTSNEKIQIGGSNNTNFDPREDLENINHLTVESSG